MNRLSELKANLVLGTRFWEEILATAIRVSGGMFTFGMKRAAILDVFPKSRPMFFIESDVLKNSGRDF